MDREAFFHYLQSETTHRTGYALTEKAAKDVLSRCRTIERKLKIQLEDYSSQLEKLIERMKTDLPEQLGGKPRIKDYVRAAQLYVSFLHRTRRST
jgi:hypothetical protein